MLRVNRIRQVSEKVLTAVSKFRVPFGDLVDMERNLAKMALTQNALNLIGVAF